MIIITLFTSYQITYTNLNEVMYICKLFFYRGALCSVISFSCRGKFEVAKIDPSLTRVPNKIGSTNK